MPFFWGSLVDYGAVGRSSVLFGLTCRFYRLRQRLMASDYPCTFQVGPCL